jgi:aldose 1-epimerase
MKIDRAGDVSGKAVNWYTLENSRGMKLRLSNYGAAVIQVFAPDRAGQLEDVVLGYDDLEGYLDGKGYFGFIVGRYGNRIAKSRFTLNGRTYNLTANNGANSLHGGLLGFNTKVWDASAEGNSVTFSYVSPDGEMGYPGALHSSVRYTLAEDNKIDVVISAAADADTVVNLTNHSYWNLTGAKTGILDHELQINASHFTPTDAELIPTGEIKETAGTPFDFLSVHKIGERIDAADEVLRYGGGYDHNFMLDGPGFRKAVDLYDCVSGRALEIYTDQPAIQMYTGNYLDTKGKGGRVYSPNWGVALETQFPPDCPNQRSFPSTVLKAGDSYRHHTRFVLSTR